MQIRRLRATCQRQLLDRQGQISGGLYQTFDRRDSRGELEPSILEYNAHTGYLDPSNANENKFNIIPVVGCLGVM